MRVAVLHSRYLSGPASGENRIVDAEIDLLRSAGHAVETVMPTAREMTPRQQARAGFAATWSPRATAVVRDLIARFHPDVIHCHNLFPLLSPAVIGTAAARGTPVVMTLHNYRLMCVSGNFLRDGHPCEDCFGHLPWRGVVHGCYQGSVLASGAIAAAVSAHRALRTFDRVALFLADGEFVKRRHLDAGMFAGRIRAKPQFCPATARRVGAGKYFLYVGRLHSEKGVRVLLDAWRDVAAELVIVGDGPEAASLRASAPPRVTFTGQLPGDAIPALMREARALLVPSVWYEGSPRTIVEAYAAGIPVVASRIGALPDVVSDGRSGLLVTPGAVAAWATAVRSLLDDDLAARLGDGAYARWRHEFRPEDGLAHLQRAYRDAIALARADAGGGLAAVTRLAGDSG